MPFHVNAFRSCVSNPKCTCWGHLSRIYSLGTAMAATIERYRPAVHSMQWLGSANIIHTLIRFVAAVCHELYTTKVNNKETVSQSTAPSFPRHSRLTLTLPQYDASFFPWGDHLGQSRHNTLACRLQKKKLEVVIGSHCSDYHIVWF